MRKDPILAITVLADVFVWFIGSMQILVINKMGRDQCGFTKTATSALVASELVGLALGGALAIRIAKGRRWYRVLVPAGFVMAAMTASVSMLPMLPVACHFWVLAGLLGTLGIAGGLFMIPCESFIQVRPDAHCKGCIIAAANCAVFIGILLSGLVANVLNEHLLLGDSFFIMGVATLVVTFGLVSALRGEDRRP